MIYIFDLDGTVIDTSHRYRNKPDGTIDLEYWFTNSTPEKVAQDKLLPLADVWRRYWAAGHTVVVCTARDFEPHAKVPLDNPGEVYRQFLHDNGLHYHHLLHRRMYGDDHEGTCDGQLKTKLLNDLATREGWPSGWRRNAVMFDDNLTVIKKMFQDRLICLNAVKYNARLAA